MIFALRMQSIWRSQRHTILHSSHDQALAAKARNRLNLDGLSHSSSFLEELIDKHEFSRVSSSELEEPACYSNGWRSRHGTSRRGATHGAGTADIENPLWEKSPQLVRDIRDELAKLGRDIAHTSVIATLNTMVKKRIVIRKRGRKRIFVFTTDYAAGAGVSICAGRHRQSCL